MNSFFEKQIKDLERNFEYSKIQETVPVYYGDELPDFRKSSVYSYGDELPDFRKSSVYSYGDELPDFRKSSVYSYGDEINLEPIYDKSPPQIMTNHEVTPDPDNKKYFYYRSFFATVYFIIMVIITIVGVDRKSTRLNSSHEW